MLPPNIILADEEVLDFSILPRGDEEHLRLEELLNFKTQFYVDKEVKPEAAKRSESSSIRMTASLRSVSRELTSPLKARE